MNSYTDKDMSILSFISVIGLAISLALFLSLVPLMTEYENRLDKLEQEIAVESVEEVR